MQKKLLLTILIIAGLSPLKAQIVPIDSIQGYADNSPYANRTVTTVGVVTATVQDWVRYIRGFFIQDAELPWHGIYVYTGNLVVNVERGDSVLVTGRVTEYYGLTEISPSSASDIVVIKKGAKLPRPLKITANLVNTEPYEGVLVRVDSVTVTNSNLGNYQFEVRDPSGNSCIIQNCAGFSYNPSNGNFIPSIIGVIYYSYNAFKICPRRDADIIFSGDGTGSFYFTDNVIATSEEKSLIINVEASSPFTIRGIKIVAPQGFQITGNVVLGGEGFQNANVNISNDTIIVENAEIEASKTGFIQITRIYAPSQPGTYTFRVFTFSSSNFAENPDAPKVNVVSILGGGSAFIAPEVVPINTPSQIKITLTNTFGALRKVKVILPSSQYYNWDRSLTLTGSGFAGATYIISNDTIVIENCAVDSVKSGEIIFNNFTFVQVDTLPSDSSEGIKTFKVFTGTQDSVAPIQNNPRLFIAMPDTTIKLKYFHRSQEKSFLLGKTVLVKGVVSGVIGDRTYLQDSTGGIIIYRGPSLSENSFVKIQGQYGEYRNSSQLYSAQIVTNYGTAPVDTTILNLPPIEDHEGILVLIQNLTPPPGISYFIPDSALVFRDSLNREYRIYVSSSTDLAFKPIPQGKLDIVGCVYQFDANYNIQPRRTKDVKAKGNGTGEFTLNPPYTYFDSLRNIKLSINSPFAPIKALEIYFVNAQVDTFYLTGAGFSNPVMDSFYSDSSGTYLKISGGMELENDTITFVRLRVTDSTEVINFVIKTSVDSAGFLAPILDNPKLYVATPVGYARQNGPDGYTPLHLNKTFTVVGVVSAPPRVFSTTRTSMYIQDETGGINVYYSGSYIDFNEGDLVRIKGTILIYNGLTEISPSSNSDIVLLGRSSAPEPYDIPQGHRLAEHLEGLLVKVTGTVANTPYSSGSGKAFTIYSGTAPIDVYAYNTTGIDLSGVVPGSVYTIYGIVGQYDATEPYTSGYQLLPRFQSDIVSVTPPGTGEELTLKTSPKVFSPFLGEAVRLEVSVEPGTIYNLKIFNSTGKLVKTLALNKTVPAVYEWRGVDDREAQLPIGLYIALLEYTKPDGSTGRVQKTIILSRPK